jgi:hypothetical protein
MEEPAPLTALQLVLDGTGRGSRVTLFTVTTLGSVVNVFVLRSLSVIDQTTAEKGSTN